jgi:hypothetical protein
MHAIELFFYFVFVILCYVGMICVNKILGNSVTVGDLIMISIIALIPPFNFVFALGSLAIVGIISLGRAGRFEWLKKRVF